VLGYLAWIIDWAERIPNDESDKSAEWPRSEIGRIGWHLDQRPAEYGIRMPKEEKISPRQASRT